MEAILIGLALTAIVVFPILLAVLVAGIRREEHAATLTCQPPGLGATLTRRLLGVYTCVPTEAQHCGHQDCGSRLVPREKE
jgi:hypothetical protein